MRLYKNEIDETIWTEEEIQENIGSMQTNKNISFEELLEMIENHDFLNSEYSFVEISK